jgi:hypothetical protein
LAKPSPAKGKRNFSTAEHAFPGNKVASSLLNPVFNRGKISPISINISAKNDKVVNTLDPEKLPLA